MSNNKHPWAWVPTLYFAEGLPYVLVMSVSVILYKNLGISNSDIAFFTSWLYLPWVVKPLWSPLVDLFRTKRWWITTMQWVLGVSLGGVALLLPAPDFFRYTLLLFWLMAFSSATHDISADGFYMIALAEKEQSLFVGIRNICYRCAMIFGQGGLVYVAGHLMSAHHMTPQLAWTWILGGTGLLLLLLGLYHAIMLPQVETSSKPAKNACLEKELNQRESIGDLFISFIQKKHLLVAILFILLYRLGEAQLGKIASPFLMDARDMGGLGLPTDQVGLIYGTIGVIALLFGGILGGVLASQFGLKKCLWWMVGAMNLPNLVYVWLAYAQPDNFVLIASAIALEQLGYGVGFTAFTLYLIYFSQGKYKTSHYSICTGLMALGMMIPGMFAGYIQEHIGYGLFFVWVCICTLPGILLAALLKIDPAFGKKG